MTVPFFSYMNLHELDRMVLLDISAAWRAGSLGSCSAQMVGSEPEPTKVSPSLSAQSKCLTKLVIPAFEMALKLPDLWDKVSERVVFSPLATQGSDQPHTVDRGPEEPVLISLNWGGSPDDVICLAHEFAHALQIILSDHKQMPPLAREVCAFLGELLLIEHARTEAPELYPSLCSVWYRENSAYLGSDFEALSAALDDPQALYHYRQNYPIARLAAVELFNRGDENWLRQMFFAGKDGMRYVPIEDLANRAGDIANYLPPMPHPEPETPAIDSYRGLGAMALLDIDYWEGQSQTRIEEYYADLLRHLRDQSAFVALDPQCKPIGFATWLKTVQGDEYILTRQAAPFGDHLALQRALERHLGRAAGVSASHKRSERQEQVAW